MKRRVIQLAGKTHVVSLPSKWVKNYNISKGDIMDLEELGNNILVKPEKIGTKIKRISIKIDGFIEPTLKYTLSALHKAGYDEITLYSEDQKFNDTVHNLIKNLLLGFIVIEQTSKKMVLKNISNEVETEFDPAMRRAFLVAISLANSSLETIASEQFSKIDSLLSLENTNNQLTNFCLRLISKGLYKDQDKKMFIITILWGLEKITDEYKWICRNIINNKKPINQEILNVYKEVNGFFYSYYDLMYSFSVEKINNLSIARNKLLEKLKTIEPKTKEEAMLAGRLTTLVSKTSDLSSSMFALHHKELAYDIS